MNSTCLILCIASCIVISFYFPSMDSLNLILNSLNLFSSRPGLLKHSDRLCELQPSGSCFLGLASSSSSPGTLVPLWAIFVVGNRARFGISHTTVTLWNHHKARALRISFSLRMLIFFLPPFYISFPSVCISYGGCNRSVEICEIARCHQSHAFHFLWKLGDRSGSRLMF